MTARLSSLFLLAALLAFPASAKDKKKSSLPEYVLRATTVLVVVSPRRANRSMNPGPMPPPAIAWREPSCNGAGCAP